MTTVPVPVVGLPACARTDPRGRLRHEVLERYVRAVKEGADALPVLIPPIGGAALALLPRLDGLLLTGSPSNVHPSLYAGGASETPDRHDPDRDATTLPLIRAAIAAGLPLLAICRGFQELNVALGGTLHQQVHRIPGRSDHDGGEAPSLAHQYRPRHEIVLCGGLAALLGVDRLQVNSIHEQAIDRPAPGLAVEALAEDGTPEAGRVLGARAFAYGVQWHPEWEFWRMPASARLFAAFGQACRAHAALSGDASRPT